MAAYDLGEGLFEHCDVELAGQTHRAAHVVKGAIRLELVHEPEPLLFERQGIGAGVGAARNALPLYSLLIFFF